jgi:hypothetical protein
MPNKSKTKTKARRKQPAKKKPLLKRVPKGQSRVLAKPPQKPKYNVLGTAIGGIAKALDNKYTGGVGHKIFTALTGSGDYVEEVKKHEYEVEANTVVHPTMSPEIPRITDDGGLVRVRHREFITNIAINTNGESFGSLRLQPGDAKTFPWLAALGNRFQQYKVLGAVFEYVTLCGNAVSAPTPALGQINMVATYDVARQVPTDPVERLNTYFSNSGVISADLMMALECETTEQPCQIYNVYDVDGKTVPTDLRWYNFANVSYQILGAPPAESGNYIAGQLWITYDVLLIKPVYVRIQSFVPPMDPDHPQPPPPSPIQDYKSQEKELEQGCSDGQYVSLCTM